MVFEIPYITGCITWMYYPTVFISISRNTLVATTNAEEFCVERAASRSSTSLQRARRRSNRCSSDGWLKLRRGTRMGCRTWPTSSAASRQKSANDELLSRLKHSKCSTNTSNATLTLQVRTLTCGTCNASFYLLAHHMWYILSPVQLCSLILLCCMRLTCPWNRRLKQRWPSYLFFLRRWHPKRDSHKAYSSRHSNCSLTRKSCRLASITWLDILWSSWWSLRVTMKPSDSL